MESEKTMLFNLQDTTKSKTRTILKEVYHSLEERGYQATNQMVGYLISGDPGYISSYQDARSKMQKLDRAKVVEILLKNFMQ